MSSIKKVLIIKVIAAIFCIAVGVVSFFLIADKLGNVDFHADTINALDKSRSKVMELAAAAVASSSAITLLPGDVGTPIAQELADMSKYFLIVLCAIYLEKFLLTVTGFVAFKYVIPVACVLFIVFIASNEKIFAKIATKLFLFSLVISFTIPISVNIANMIESNYASSIDTTLNNAKENTDTVTKSAEEENKNSSAIEKIVNNITGNVNELLKKFENTLSSFIEAIAVLIVTSCLIPIGVLLFFLWLVKLVFSIDVNNFSFIRRE
nr:beta-carotene 15,15'-monooxygenase [uncultured Lachnoanaerobaculum sp.]